MGISFDSVAKNAAFAKKYNFPFLLLCDTDRKVGMAYGACDSPNSSSAKRITYVIGPDGKILQAHETVQAKSHAEDVLCTLG